MTESNQSDLFAGDIPASLLALPGSERARMMTATSGRNYSALHKRSDPLGSCVRTLLDTSAWASTVCWLTWKAKATPAKRLLFQLVPSEPTTGGTGFGFWRTPTSNSGGGCDVEALLSKTPRPSGARRTMTLNHQVKDQRLWPTPAARDYKGGRKLETLKEAGRNETNSLPDAVNVANQATGSLNPQWVEWLMGFPEGWTDLSNSEMQ